MIGLFHRNRVVLHGDWNLNRMAELRELLGQLTPNCGALIDLSDCTYSDSTVLAALGELRRRLSDVPVTLVRPAPKLRRLLRTSHLDTLFQIR
jgi:anti-anti-sigma regulatory factor